MKIKDLSELLNGYAFKSSNYINTGHRIIRITNVQSGYLEDEKPVFYAQDDKLNKYELKENDILISLTGNVGRCAMITNDFLPAYLNQRVCCLRVDTKKVLPKFLFYLLNSKKFEFDCINSSQGIAQLNMSTEWLKEYNLDIPSIEEQRKIINVFDKVYKNIEIRKKQINSFDYLIKSQFVEMFGNPVLNEKDFDKRRLFDKCDIVTGNTPSRKIDDYYGDYIEWIKSDNIIDNSTYLTLAKEFLSEQGLEVGRYVDKDCILMTCIAGSLNSIGNVAITDRKVSFNQQINGIIPRENDVYFMYEQFVLSKDYLHSPVNMSLKGILSKNQLGNLEFIFPPIELQKQFGKFYKQVAKQKFEFEKQLEKLKELQSALMQEYFG